MKAIIIIALISIVPDLTNKGEHTALYKMQLVISKKDKKQYLVNPVASTVLIRYCFLLLLFLLHVFLSCVLSLICEAVPCLELFFAELGQAHYKYNLLLLRSINKSEGINLIKTSIIILSYWCIPWTSNLNTYIHTQAYRRNAMRSGVGVGWEASKKNEIWNDLGYCLQRWVFNTVLKAWEDWIWCDRCQKGVVLAQWGTVL